LKVICFTDFHGNTDAFRNAVRLIRDGKWDCVIVAGDIVNHDLDLAKRRLTELAEAGGPLFYVPGNMDSPELSSWSGTSSAHPLHGKTAVVDGAFLVGLGGSPPGPFHTPFEVRDEEATQLLSQAMAGFGEGALVLVSHCPPKNTKLDAVHFGGHAGSTPVRNFVEKFKPALVISGHIHEAKGIDSIGETTLVNAGPAQRGNYAEITLNHRASVKLGNFF
jgi:Icc-related predicted phosphoesterase